MAKPKTDLVGNPLQDSGKKGKKSIPKLTVVVKRSAVPIVGGAVAGAVSTGVALAIVSKVPMLRKWAQEGGFKRAAVVTGVSLGVAGLGLLVMGKVTTPRKAVDAAPFVLGGSLLTAMAPVLAAEIVSRIDTLLQGVFGPTPGGARRSGGTTTSGASNNGGPLGERKALTAAEVSEAERVRTQTTSRPTQTVDMSARW